MDSENRQERENRVRTADLSKGRIMAMFTVTHFLVDLACIFMMTAFLIPSLPNRTAWLWCVIIYNFCAFALQLPVGAAADKIGKPAAVSAFGCLLIAVSFLLTRLPMAAAVAAGVGNACFHIGGGVFVLKISERKAALSGIYVSTGALGVYLASKLAAGRSAVFMGIPFYLSAAFVMIILMLICSVSLAAETIKAAHEEKRNLLSDNRNGNIENGIRICDFVCYSKPQFFLFIVTVFSLTFTICLRSYVGTILNFDWKSDESLGFAFVLGIVFGKMAGGIIGDRFGWLKTSGVSLCISAILFIFAPSIPACGIPGVFLFNMTMPVTLTAIANIYPQDQGLAFGITTFALFIGVIPSMFGAANTVIFSFRTWLTICVIVSAAALAAGLKGYKYLQSRVQETIKDSDQ
ncbi:MAG: MFS transporter [Firmicutes bacterium]|nr:MFS transporter [Bacillota bacterium]